MSTANINFDKDDYPDPATIKTVRDPGPARSKLFLAVKQILIGGVCVSTFVINLALLSDVLDYLNAVNLQSLASGIVTGLSLVCIMFKLIGLFAIIKEDFAFTFIFSIMVAGVAISTLAIFHILFHRQFDTLFVTVLASNTFVAIVALGFSLMIRVSDGHGRVSPTDSPEIAIEIGSDKSNSDGHF